MQAIRIRGISDSCYNAVKHITIADFAVFRFWDVVIFIYDELEQED